MLDGIEGLSAVFPELIREMDAIKVRRETYLKATKARFNIFTVLRKAHEEVGLHTRFLSLMLDPNGSHDCGDLFLGLFIETLKAGVLSHEDELLSIPKFSDCLIKSFEKIEQEQRHDCGQIDICIYFKEFILIIENKIYANEQNDQIFRYNQRIKPSGKHGVVLFLSLDGKQSETAGAHENKYFRISYSQHILIWLEKCLEKTYRYPNINSALQQYKNVIAGLTGKDHLAETNMQEMKELFRKYPQAIEFAEDIKECSDSIKQEVIEQFWVLLKSNLKSKNINCIGEEHKTSYTGVFLDRFVETGGRCFNFYIEKKSWNFCCGIGLHPWQYGKNNYYSDFKEQFDWIWEKLNDEKKLITSKPNSWWPLGQYSLFVPDIEWFKRLLNDDLESDLKIETEKAAQLVKTYIDFVELWWKQR